MTPRDLVSRSKQIKAVLERKFGRGNVRVKTETKGSAYGWVDVYLSKATTEIYTGYDPQVRRLIKDAGIKLDTWHDYDGGPNTDGTYSEYDCLNVDYFV